MDQGFIYIKAVALGFIFCGGRDDATGAGKRGSYFTPDEPDSKE
jgi:hypothetical protein